MPYLFQKRGIRVIYKGSIFVQKSIAVNPQRICKCHRYIVLNGVSVILIQNQCRGHNANLFCQFPCGETLECPVILQILARCGAFFIGFVVKGQMNHDFAFRIEVNPCVIEITIGKPMNLFETVKSAVTVKQAAEYYGCKVNRGDMICCPFHDDRHPSMKLNRDYFYCFGCGVTGDVIDFVARLFGLSSYEAAKKLAYDFGIDPDKPPAAMALKKPYPLARAFRNDEMYCQRVLCDYLHLLERWKVEYAPQSPEDELDDRFVEACHMIEYVNDLLDVLMFAELKQRVKAVDKLLKDGTIAALEQRLQRLEKEVQHRGEERAIA